MIKEDALGDAEAIFGMHIHHTKPAVSFFEARVEGKAGHAAGPHSSVDPILAASFTILAPTAHLERSYPLESKGGTAWNVIPPYVELRGTLRSLTTGGLHQLQKRVKEVIEGQSAVHRCIAHIVTNREDQPPYPARVNHEGLHQHVKRVGGLMLGPENVKVQNKVMAGEDFAFYQEVIPGVMFGIGIRNEKVGAVHPQHSPHFILDEDVLPI